jgi:hypothetical protein
MTHQSHDAVQLVKSAANRLEPHLRSADPAFVRLETDRDEHWSAFGRTNVLVHRVSALADMQSGDLVIEAAAKIPLGDLMRLPRKRRASHLLDLTRGHLQAGQRYQASATLLEADQLALQEVRLSRPHQENPDRPGKELPTGCITASGVIKLARTIGVTEVHHAGAGIRVGRVRDRHPASAAFFQSTRARGSNRLPSAVRI